MATPLPQRCLLCKELYQPSRNRRTQYCSRKCAQQAAAARRTEAARAHKRVRDAGRVCAHCTGPIPIESRMEAKFCSPECNSAAHQLKRKLRADGYIRAQIAERDGWICGICRAAVDPSLKHPDPGFGSLDHLVPKARGGSNAPENLRLTHLVCNLRRRADFDPAELGLSPRDVATLQPSLFDL